MNILTNDRLLQRKYFLATTLTVAGFLMLTLSSVFLFLYPSTITTLPLLPVGTIAALLGLRITNVWLRKPPPHLAIDENLKGFGKSATLLHFHTPAQHLLISEYGIFTLTTFPHPVHLNIRHDDWNSTDTLLTAFQIAIAYPALKNPAKTANHEAIKAQQWLIAHLDDHNIVVRPIIVLTSPQVTLTIEGTQTVPITTTSKTRYSLKTAIRDLAYPTLTHQQVQTLVDMLA